MEENIIITDNGDKLWVDQDFKPCLLLNGNPNYITTNGAQYWLDRDFQYIQDMDSIPNWNIYWKKLCQVNHLNKIPLLNIKNLLYPNCVEKHGVSWLDINGNYRQDLPLMSKHYYRQKHFIKYPIYNLNPYMHPNYIKFTGMCKWLDKFGNNIQNDQPNKMVVGTLYNKYFPFGIYVCIWYWIDLDNKYIIRQDLKHNKEILFKYRNAVHHYKFWLDQNGKYITTTKWNCERNVGSENIKRLLDINGQYLYINDNVYNCIINDQKYLTFGKPSKSNSDELVLLSSLLVF